jgi:hypothetical protein
MDTSLPAQLEQLRGMPAALLRARYREVFGVETQITNQNFLRRRIAWQLQVLAQGDISEAARQRAFEIAQDLELNGRMLFERPTKKNRRRVDRRLPAPGIELTRVYRNRTIVVKSVASGFECEGRHYDSLSAAARAVTGTRWNGLVFFGLAKRGENRKRPSSGKADKRQESRPSGGHPCSLTPLPP